MAFTQLGLAPKVLEGVRAAGYTDPTPIQLRAIPLLLEGRDLVGSAQTGTGKTAAFALPTLSRLKSHQPQPRCLVLGPTRELAAQVETAFRDYGRFTDLRVCVVYGGVGYEKQLHELRDGVDVIVATPGRLLDLIERGAARLDHVEVLVLDEADRMLDMGFLPDVRRILDRCPKKRQTMLFSATIPPEIETLCRWALRNPERVAIGIARSPAETVSHALYPVAEDQKDALLREILRRINFDQVLIFTRTKHGADRIHHLLRRDGHSVAVLHSDRTQAERERSLEGFRQGKVEIMVATDIASRGLDVEGISHVINYDVPLHPEDYVHRIGRTGRATAAGNACTLVVGSELDQVRAIEHFIGRKIERRKIENFNYVYTRAFEATEGIRSKAVRVGSGFVTSGFGRRRR
ncbi:MAG: DEAD/DEAH box helicase [Verrucomicrobiae bacterium]|nr:DEAD/DEAH box helicase [Verrucomicrobiae bacterium]